MGLLGIMPASTPMNSNGRPHSTQLIRISAECAITVGSESLLVRRLTLTVAVKFSWAHLFIAECPCAQDASTSLPACLPNREILGISALFVSALRFSQTSLSHFSRSASVQSKIDSGRESGRFLAFISFASLCACSINSFTASGLRTFCVKVAHEERSAGPRRRLAISLLHLKNPLVVE